MRTRPHYEQRGPALYAQRPVIAGEGDVVARPRITGAVRSFRTEQSDLRRGLALVPAGGPGDVRPHGDHFWRTGSGKHLARGVPPGVRRPAGARAVTMAHPISGSGPTVAQRRSGEALFRASLIPDPPRIYDCGRGSGPMASRDMTSGWARRSWAAALRPRNARRPGAHLPLWKR